ncbi:MAG: O-antigen ligase family protein [Proteobacteria bacterium]|nr:O-antigen ligase family protein [Pseudomonadota bacterium]
MNFLFFILVTATIFIRPGEIFPASRGFEFFFYLILPCLVLSFQAMLEQLSKRNLQAQPITLCVLGLLVTVWTSNLAHLDINAAVTQGWMFLKHVIYYTLLVSLVNTPSRFRRFLFWLWVFAMAFIVLVLLQHHGLIKLSMKETLNEGYLSATGERIEVARMTGSGMFADPNDMSVVILIGIILGIYWTGDRLFPLPRILYLASSLISIYALTQTQSRGGFIALIGACGVALLARYGWKKAAILGTAGLPLLLPIVKGRLTTISTGGTAHLRISLWNEGLVFLKSAPLFGIGAEKFRESTDSGQPAHSSYVQAYAELGFFGGTFFVGAFFLALWAIYRMGVSRAEIVDTHLQWAQPFLMAITAGIATLILTLSQTYYISTYMVLGLATAYLRVTNAPKILTGYRVNLSLMMRLARVSLLFLVGLYIFVRLFN